MQSATVTVRETYDLSSKVGQTGVLGIHSPGWNLINSQWNGLARNYRRMRLESCNVTLACASMLPMDPLGIGTGENQVSPQDMFNPILYRAVSNDSFDTVIQRMKTIVAEDSNAVLNPAGSVDYVSLGSNLTYQERIYYCMLSSSGWRKAHPQQGLSMSGLKPIFYEVVNSYGGINESPNSAGVSPYSVDDLTEEPAVTGLLAQREDPLGIATDKRRAFTMRGRPVPMPSFTLHNSPGNTDPNLCPVYCAAIMIPPAKNRVMYFRMTVSWTVTFFGLCPVSEYANLQQLGLMMGSCYTSNYGETSKDAETTTDMVDTFGGLDIQKVM